MQCHVRQCYLCLLFVFEACCFEGDPVGFLSVSDIHALPGCWRLKHPTSFGHIVDPRGTTAYHTEKMVP